MSALQIDGLHPNAIAGAAGIRPKTPLVVFPKHIHIKPTKEYKTGDLVTLKGGSGAYPIIHAIDENGLPVYAPEVQPTKLCGEPKCTNPLPHAHGYASTQPTEVASPTVYRAQENTKTPNHSYWVQVGYQIVDYSEVIADRERKAAVEALHRIQYHYLRLDENGVEQRSVHPWVRYSTVHNLIAQYERGEANDK